MKGDFSRIRFERDKHYTAVLKQQGRVDLDADANEQRAIDAHLYRTGAIDVIGPYGGPIHAAGFAITVEGGQIMIGPGRYYVDGLLCENPGAIAYEQQPFLLGASTSQELLADLNSGQDITGRVYLEVWQRLVTALDDPALGEPALGQADTTARVQTVWRVVADPGAPEPLLGIACCEDMYTDYSVKHSGSLSAQTQGGGSTCGCQPIAAAGYVGLENQLYRVEVHQSGDETSATFKWSRENGSVVTAIQGVSGDQVTVSGLGPDANLGFQVNQWVELSDDTYLFGQAANQAGALYQIVQIDPPYTVTVNAPVVGIDPTRNARMRRWDQSDGADGRGVPLSAAWVTLENGIQVCFDKGQYQAGDAWTIAARTATGQIEWPPAGSDGKAFQPPHYAHVRRAPLACIHPPLKRPASFATRRAYVPHYIVNDCRRFFPPLTDLSEPATAAALHLTGISWSNDDSMTLDTLIAQGLAVTFDQAPSGPLSPANFIVTLETPTVLNQDNYLGYRAAAPALAARAAVPDAAAPAAAAGAAAAAPAAAAAAASAPANVAAAGAAATVRAGTAARTIAVTTAASRAVNIRFIPFVNPTPTVFRNDTFLDSALALTGNTLTWSLPWQNVSTRQDLEILAIQLGLMPGAALGWPGRVRVKLAGRALFLTDPTSGQLLYLDGQAFGRASQTADGSRARVDLQFPTGNDEKASDFESWFYVYPILGITSVSVAYAALTAIDDGNAVLIYPAPLPAPPGNPVTQLATIKFSYPTALPTTLNLSLVGDSSVATVPASLAVAAGSTATTVPITIGGSPPVGTTTTFTLIASVANALGIQDAQSTSFTINGYVNIQ